MQQPLSHLWLLVGLMLVAALVRVPVLDGLVRYPEAYAFNRIVSAPLLAQFASYAVPDNHITYNLLAGGVWHTLGADVRLLRLPALAVSLLLIPLSYRVAWRLYNRRVALLTAALMAGAPAMTDTATTANGTTLAAGALLLLLGVASRAYTHARPRDGLLLMVAVAGALIAVPLRLYPALTGIGWLALTITLESRVKLWQLRVLALAVVGGMALALLVHAPLFLTTTFPAFVDAQRGGDLLALPALHAASRDLPALLFGALHAGLPPGVGGLLALVAFLGVLLHERTARGLVTPVVPALASVGLTVVLLRTVPSQPYWAALFPVYAMSIAAGAVALLPYLDGQRFQRLALGSGSLLALTGIFAPPAVGTLPDAPAVTAHLLDELRPNDAVVTLDPHAEILRYTLRSAGLAYDPVVNPRQQAFALTLNAGRVFTVSEADLRFGQATDYLTFGATNLQVTIETLAQLNETIVEEVVIDAITPVTTNVRQALFSENFEAEDLDPDRWDYDPNTARIRWVGNNRVLEIDSGDAWAFFTLEDEAGTLWTDYSVFARVRVMEPGDPGDDVFFHVRYLPPIGSYTGSINPSEDIGMLSADFERSWAGPLLPVGVQPLGDLAWHNLRLRAVGNTVQLDVNGEPLLRARDDTIRRGTMRLVVPPGHVVQVDDIVVLPEVDWALTPRHDRNHRSPNGEPNTLQLGREDDWSFLTLGGVPQLTDAALEARLRVTVPADAQYDVQLLLRQSWRGAYAAAFDADTGQAVIGHDQNGVWQGGLATADVPLSPGEWATVRVQAVEDSVSVLVDGLQVARILDDRYDAGEFSLAVPPGAQVELAWVRVLAREGE